MQRFVTYFLLFCLPLFFFPFGVSIYEPIKVIVAEIAISIGLLPIFINRKFVVRNKYFILLLILLFLLTILQLFLHRGALFGNHYRLQGVFLFWMLLILSFISSTYFLKLQRCWFVPVLFILFVLFGLLDVFNGLSRTVATLGEPNAFAAYLLFLWPIAYYQDLAFEKLYLTKEKYRFLIIFFTILLLMTTGSKSGALGFVLQVIILFLPKLIHISLKNGVYLSLTILLISFGLPFLDSSRIWENRGDIWKTAWEAGQKTIVLGGGVGVIENKIHETSSTYENAVYFQFIDSSHNIFLDWWVQSGLTGLFLFLSILIITFKQYLQNKLALNISLLIGILVALSFNPASVVTLVTLWWLLGQAFATDTF